MTYNLIISNKRFNEQDFTYHIIKNDYEEKLIQLIDNFDGFNIENISKVICYSMTKDMGHECAILFNIVKAERQNGIIKISLEKTKQLETTCDALKKMIYALQCRLGLGQEKGLYVLPVNDDDFNDLCYPEERNNRIKNTLSLLSDLKIKNKWLDMVKVFGNINDIEKNYPDYWNNAKLLDEYLVYPLSHLVTSGDKYKVREKMIPYFIKCIERVLEIMPNKINTLSVYAYFYYCTYMDYKRGYNAEDYEKAKELYLRILDIDSKHIQSLYRLSKLYQIFVSQKRFDRNLDRRFYYSEITKLYTSVIELYESDMGKYSNYEYEYVSSLYNLLKFKQDTFLNYDRAYFECKIFGADSSIMFNMDKANEIKDSLDLVNKLMKILDIDINTSPENMISKTKKDQIDVLYRTSIVYQSMAYYCDIKGRHDDSIKYFKLSNEYVSLAFNVYFARNKRGIRSIKPNYLYKMRATNSYFLGEKDKSIVSLSKGQSDSIYRAAELLYISGDLPGAKNELINIKPNDKLNMYNKADRFIKRIANV